MQILTQLSVFITNKPGVLGKVASALAKNGINILAISISDTVDHSVVRLIVDRPKKAVALFEEGGSLVIENEVLAIDLSNQPGMLAKVAQRLAKAKINIENVYGTTQPEESQSLVVFRVADPRRALKILR